MAGVEQGNPDQAENNFSRSQIEMFADRLAERGVPFEVIPKNLYPGMRYITVRALVESGITKYSQRYILSLMRNGELPNNQLAGVKVLYPEGIQALLNREEQSELENLHQGGRRPGRRGQTK